MTGNPGFIWTICFFLLVIGPLIFVHELGHYFVGRWFGIKAEVFSIGFGKELFGWTDKRGTRWKLAWLPLGGYVKFAGDMNPASQPDPNWLNLPAEERAQTFQAKPVWQRFLVVAAGPVTNFLFAILVFLAVFLALGLPRTPPVAAQVSAGSAAAAAGIVPGDRLLSIDGEEVSQFEDIAQLVVWRAGQRVEIELLRGGRTLKVAAVPRTLEEKDQFGNVSRRAILGVAPGAHAFERVGPVEAVAGSVKMVWRVVTMTVEGIGQIIVGRQSVKELGGPLKIAKFSGEQAALGWMSFVWFMAVISVNLGFINLLPIPLLDGGHLLFYAIEGVRRRPLRPETQEWAFRTGLAALLGLMIFVTLNDLASFGLWAKLGGLIG